MRGRLTFILAMCSFPCFGQTEMIELDDYGNSLEDVIPKGWKIVSQSFGDLTADGIEDVVIVIQGTDSTKIDFNEDIEADPIDLNPRILAIFSGGGTSRGFTKKMQANEFIIGRDSPTMDEPFDGVEITKNGTLKIDFHFWYSFGSWSTSNHTYLFRYQHHQFELIGYDSYESDRGNGETTDRSINFSTRKMKITKGNSSEDEPHSVEWKEFELDELKTLESLGKPFEWEFMGTSL